MPKITVFRSGSTFSLEPLPDAESTTLLVHPEVVVRKSGLSGRFLLYRDPGPYGQSVTAAIQLGWAQLASAASDEE